MIEEQQARVYYSSRAGRRFFTKAGAISGEAKAMLRKKYPSEESENDESGRLTYPGWHWSSLENADEIYTRLCRYLKYRIEKPSEEGLGDRK